MTTDKKLELHIPSVLGFEKVAMQFAASVAKMANVPDDRIEDLKTAVAEACLNAIEHGNKLDAAMTVGITLTLQDSGLHVAVHDQGHGVGDVATPNIEDAVDGTAQQRGWGIFLIRSLMDDVAFESSPEGGNVMKMRIHLTK
jgi:serine/threonine-protein kinase RsbW